MIAVDGLTYTYPGGRAPAIADLTFSVTEGEVFGFLGPSGAGKSTTQKVLVGLLRGWGGAVALEGRPLSSWGSELYTQIGISFEFPNHYLKLTARENLEYFRALYGGRTEPVDEVLERVDLLADADRPVAAFSRGMKNRLNFARSFLHRPRIWFLDEPTTGLDPVNARRIREIVRSRQRDGVTTVVTTHDMTTADAVCDRVAFIVDGHLAAIGAPAELRRRHGRREVEVAWDGGPEGPGSATFPLDGLADDLGFREALRRPDLAAVHSQEATLEDVFVEVTGRSLR